MRNREKVIKTDSREVEAITGGLIGVAVIAVIQLLGIPSLGVELTFSLYSFTVAIPLLSLTLLSIHVEAPYKFWVDVWYIRLPTYLGMAAAILGLVGLIWSLSDGATFLFLGLAMFVMVAWNRYDAVMKSANSPKPKGQ